MAATLTDEARELAKTYIQQLLDQWDVPDGVRHDLMVQNTTLKSVAIVRIRRQLVRILRDRCWQDSLWRPEEFLIDHAKPEGPWHHLTTTNIGRLLEVHYTTVIGLLKPTAAEEMEEQRRLDKAEVSATGSLKPTAEKEGSIARAHGYYN